MVIKKIFAVIAFTLFYLGLAQAQPITFSLAKPTSSAQDYYDTKVNINDSNPVSIGGSVTVELSSLSYPNKATCVNVDTNKTYTGGVYQIGSYMKYGLSAPSWEYMDTFISSTTSAIEMLQPPYKTSNAPNLYARFTGGLTMNILNGSLRPGEKKCGNYYCLNDITGPNLTPGAKYPYTIYNCKFEHAI